MSGDAVIQVEGLWKRYGLPLVPAIKRAAHGIRQRLSPSSAKPFVESLPWALQGISFTVNPGETFGLIGRNGSGKSTLLKVLAGVTPPTQGQVSVSGHIFPMIELNAGIHPDLTGRENIGLLGALVGLTRSEIAEKMADIEAFCELGEWLDRPVRMYSSGMMVRLGFAVGVYVNPDVLLMDEILAVGDLGFQNKSLQHLEGLRSRGKCTIFVSHNMHRVRRMCDRILVLERGKPIFLGDPGQAIEIYEETIQQGAGREGTGGDFDYLGVTLKAAQLTQAGGPPVETIPQGGDVTLRFTLGVSEGLKEVSLNVALLTRAEGLAAVFESLIMDRLEPGRHDFELVWRNLRLQAGYYPLRIAITSGSVQHKGFRVNNAVTLRMAGDLQYVGIYQPESSFREVPAD